MENRPIPTHSNNLRKALSDLAINPEVIKTFLSGNQPKPKTKNELMERRLMQLQVEILILVL
jgi:hypothetical protein